MWIVVSQQLVGAGAILATLAIMGEVAEWLKWFGAGLYIIGLVMGQYPRGHNG